jgi:hypothetical protein
VDRGKLGVVPAAGYGRRVAEVKTTTFETGGRTVKRLFALIVGVACVAGVTGSVLAQGGTATPKEDKKVDKPAAEPKKPTAQNASGTVKTAAADSLVVSGKAKGGKDAEWTFAVDPKTKIRKAGKDITATDLATGDPVLVRYHDLAGKHVAESVMVRTVKKPVTETPKAEMPKKDEPKK